MEAEKLNNVSIKEYVSVEKEAEKKYEYHDGTISAMAGGTLEHGLICGNIFGEIRTALRNKKSNCKPINSEVKLHVQSVNRFLYPDTMVICGEIEKSKDEINAVTNPILIVEVVSKSSASYDRGDKFYFYRQIETLQEYIIIEQEKALVEIYKRKGDLWKITRISGLECKIFLSSLDVEIDLVEVYRDVEISFDSK
jgi:Uma2 family endonuclease